MRWANMYFLGFCLLVTGVVAALWKIGLLENVGAAWTAIGVLIAVGIGIMVSVASGRSQDTVHLKR